MTCMYAPPMPPRPARQLDAGRPLAKDQTVIKYGTDIGRAVAAIGVGEHAHVHNIKTKRW